MIVYAATKQQFLDVCDNDDIEEVILKHFKEATGKKVAASEIRSWQGSLTYMARFYAIRTCRMTPAWPLNCISRSP